MRLYPIRSVLIPRLHYIYHYTYIYTQLSVTVSVARTVYIDDCTMCMYRLYKYNIISLIEVFLSHRYIYYIVVGFAAAPSSSVRGAIAYKDNNVLYLRRLARRLGHARYNIIYKLGMIFFLFYFFFIIYYSRIKN